MAHEGPQILIPGLKAGADLSAAANQYKLVKLSAVNTVILCAATTDVPIGVLQDTPKSGAAATVASIGLTKVVCGADLAVGDLIGTNASGQAVKLTPGTSTTAYIVGQVVSDNSASGGLSTVMLNCASPGRAA